jgi:SAM-dependent methyltransferase
VNESLATSGLPLPPPAQRLGGRARSDDAAYISSAIDDVRFLELECGLSVKSSLLDIGCGQGRLLHGIVRCFGGLARYVGIDANEVYFSWLQTHLAPILPFAAFHRVAYRNERYNPREDQCALDVPFSDTFDCVTMLSLFTHMRLVDVRRYLGFVKRSLSEDGSAYLTIFVEDGVEAEIENPDNYGRKQWSGPLHCVRFNRQVFERAVRDNGLGVHLFRHHPHGRVGSLYILKHA